MCAPQSVITDIENFWNKKNFELNTFKNGFQYQLVPLAIFSIEKYKPHKLHIILNADHKLSYVNIHHIKIIANTMLFKIALQATIPLAHTPHYTPYIAPFIAMAMGILLKQQIKCYIEPQEDYIYNCAILQLIERSAKILFDDAQDLIKSSLTNLYGKYQITMEQFNEAFTKGKIVDFLIQNFL
jgi:hypothetical protein